MSLNEEVLDIKKAENYLLGILTDDEAFNFECDVFPDENLSEQLEIVRLQLSEKYLANELNRQQRQQFENHFLAFPYNSELFAFHKSLNIEINRRNLMPEENEDVSTVTTEEKKTGFWNRLFDFFPLKTFAVPAFAALVLIVLGGVFLYKSRQNNEIAKTETPTPTPISQISPAPTLNPAQTPTEITDNSSKGNENKNSNSVIKEQNQNTNSQPPDSKKDVSRPNVPMVATIVLLGTFRDVATEEKPIIVGQKTQNININFQYPKENPEADYKNYKIILETTSGNKVLVKNLSKEGKKSGDNLTENISPNLLQTGKYRFRLVGVFQNDKEETVDSDTFFVKRVS